MAYQTRQRDPLLDGQMQEILNRRGVELIGFALIGLGTAFAALLWSYVPDDPNFLAATDSAPANWLGRTGATVATILTMILGHAAWLLPLVCAAWGVRLVLHSGVGRLWRAFLLPILLTLGAAYFASHIPPSDWPERTGAGGALGDLFLGMLINILPLAPAAGIKIAAFLTFMATIALTLYVIGMTQPEARSVTRFLLVGSISTSIVISGFLSRVSAQIRALVSGQLARHMERRSIARDQRERMVKRPAGAEPHQTTAHTGAAATGMAGLLSRMPRLLGDGARDDGSLPDADPLLVEDIGVNEAHRDEERMSRRISDAIKARVRRTQPQEVDFTPEGGAYGGPHGLGNRIEPPLTADPAISPLPAPPEGSVWEDGLPNPEAFAMEHGMAQPYAPVSVQALEPQPQPMQARPQAEPASQVQPKTVVQRQKAASTSVVPYEFPPMSLLTDPTHVERHHLPDEVLEQNARMLESVLDDYGVKGEIVSVRPGPVVTMYELEPAPGLKASRVIGLADDIARSMSALSARVSTVPGRTVIGIELPNQNREMVVLREILAHPDFGGGSHKLPLALGKDIGGEPIIANLAKMPHLLIAGTTGSGKSVAINTMILSLLYKLKPEDCRMIMIDPKMLELSVYDGIPHLLSPVVTDPKKAVVALKWVVAEMEERYRKMSKMGVRNIDGYNGRVKDALSKGEMFSRTFQTGFDDETGEPVFETEEYTPEKMPYIVVIVDEMADLMMVAGKEIEACIQRLAQMARASGIHIIMATQRPSVDVITGTIKANFPTRISFHVTSKVDSRTILGEMGAEQLLGMGDMLYMAGGAKITRVHGPFCSDEEVEEIVNHLKAFGPPDYAASVLDGPDSEKESDIDAVLGLNTGGNTNGEDALYDQAVAVVAKDRKCSTSYIQRKLGIGYNKAARLVEQMEEQGLVSAANHVGKREILIPEQD